MIKKITYLSTFILLTSCFLNVLNEGVFLELYNNTNEPITNVKFGTLDETFIEIDKVNSGEIIEKKLNLSDIHKKDITYLLSYTLSDGKMITKTEKFYRNKTLSRRELSYRDLGENPGVSILEAGN